LKKPFTLSDTVEFMVGAGPEWKINTRSVAGEVALDFMFWPLPERKYGWFLEPSYSYDFGAGHEQSLRGIDHRDSMTRLGCNSVSGHSQRPRATAASMPKICATMKAKTPAGAIPA
jgi:hypothetical protein